jgi:hypothetical protein
MHFPRGPLSTYHATFAVPVKNHSVVKCLGSLRSVPFPFLHFTTALSQGCSVGGTSPHALRPPAYHPRLGRFDSATIARPTGHVHKCQNDPHMSQLPCTGSHIGGANWRSGPKRGRIHALSQHPEPPALRTSVCDAARSLRIGGRTCCMRRYYGRERRRPGQKRSKEPHPKNRKSTSSTSPSSGNLKEGPTATSQWGY